MHFPLLHIMGLLPAASTMSWDLVCTHFVLGLWQWESPHPGTLGVDQGGQETHETARDCAVLGHSSRDLPGHVAQHGSLTWCNACRCIYYEKVGMTGLRSVEETKAIYPDVLVSAEPRA